jgi:hypothetical protein
VPSPNEQQTQSDGQRIESSYVTPPAGDWEAEPARQSLWAEHFGLIQLAALAITLLGIILTLIAAIQAANPTTQVVVTLLGVALLMATIWKPPEAAR